MLNAKVRDLPGLDRSLSLYQRVYLLFHGCLRGGEAGDGHTEWRARCVVHANLCAELHRAGLTTMLTTDTATQFRTNLTTLLYSVLDELTNTLLVENLEWVNLQNLLVEVAASRMTSFCCFNS